MFMTVAALCCAIGLWKLRDLSAHRFLTSPYFFTLLSGICLVLVASAYRSRAQISSMRLLKYLGCGLAIISLVAGWILTR